jgi:hypothetical protein
MKMWQEYLPHPAVRVAAMICVAPDVDEWVRGNASEQRPHPGAVMQFANIPIYVQPHYAPGEWRMFDQFGEELSRGQRS